MTAKDRTIYRIIPVGRRGFEIVAVTCGFTTWVDSARTAEAAEKKRTRLEAREWKAFAASEALRKVVSKNGKVLSASDAAQGGGQ